MTDDLAIPAIPAFLDRRGEAVRPWRAPRWRRLPPPRRPDGDRWANAERWEVYVPQGPLSYTNTAGRACGIASGRRRVWVVEGRKWARVADAENQVKASIADWRRMQRHGRQV